MKGLLLALIAALVLGLSIGVGQAVAAYVFAPTWVCQYLETAPGENLWTILPAGGQVGGVVAIALREVPESMRPYPEARQQACFILGHFREE